MAIAPWLSLKILIGASGLALKSNNNCCSYIASWASMYIEVESVGWWVAMKWWITAKLRNLQGEMALTKTPLHSKCH